MNVFCYKSQIVVSIQLVLFLEPLVRNFWVKRPNICVKYKPKSQKAICIKSWVVNEIPYKGVRIRIRNRRSHILGKKLWSGPGKRAVKTFGNKVTFWIQVKSGRVNYFPIGPDFFYFTTYRYFWSLFNVRIRNKNKMKISVMSDMNWWSMRLLSKRKPFLHIIIH